MVFSEPKITVIAAGRSRGPEREFGDATPEAIVCTVITVCFRNRI